MIGQMPYKGKLIRMIADDESWQCKETLRRALNAAVQDAIDRWPPEEIAQAISELADEQMDRLVDVATQQISSVGIH